MQIRRESVFFSQYFAIMYVSSFRLCGVYGNCWKGLNETNGVWIKKDGHGRRLIPSYAKKQAYYLY